MYQTDALSVKYEGEKHVWQSISRNSCYINVISNISTQKHFVAIVYSAFEKY